MKTQITYCCHKNRGFHKVSEQVDQYGDFQKLAKFSLFQVRFYLSRFSDICTEVAMPTFYKIDLTTINKKSSIQGCGTQPT